MTTFVSIFTIKMYDLYFLDKQQDGWDSLTRITERQPRQRQGSEGRKKGRQRDDTGPNKRKGVDGRVGEDRSLAFRPGGLHHAVDGYSLVRNYSWEEPLLNILNYRTFLHFYSTMLNQKVHLRFTFFFFNYR